MKLFFSLFLLLLIGCEKQHINPTPLNKFTARVNLSPSKTTLYYDVFASNDKNYWVKIKYIENGEQNLNNFSFEFTLEPFWCNGVLAVDPNKKLYGAIRETKAGNVVAMLPDNSIVIKK